MRGYIAPKKVGIFHDICLGRLCLCQCFKVSSSIHGRTLTLQALRQKMYKVVVAQPPPPPGLGWNDFGDSFGIYLGSSLQLV